MTYKHSMVDDYPFMTYAPVPDAHIPLDSDGIADDAITTDKIADGAVTSDKLAEESPESPSPLS